MPSRFGLTIPQFAPTERAKAARRKLLLEAKDSAAVQLLIGDAIGDAFGFGIEMQDAGWIRKKVTKFDAFPDNPVLIDAFKVNNERGFYSDDAEQTVGLMKALCDHGVDVDKDKMLEAWHEEWEIAKRRPEPAVPGGERQGHGSIKYFWRGKSTLDEVRKRQAEKVDPGNAPPMRALPLGFVASVADRERLCAANADSTHPHPRARAAAFLIASACHHLVVQKNDPSDVLTAALRELEKSSLRDDATIAHLRELIKLPDYHDYGWRFEAMPPEVHSLLCGPQPCPHTLSIPVGDIGDYGRGLRMHGIYTDSMRTAGAVLYLLSHHRGALDVLRASVDLGGDVDSIAALCLGMVGGSMGLKFGEAGGLPWALLEELEGVEYLVNTARAFEDGFARKEADKERGGGGIDRSLIQLLLIGVLSVLVTVIATIGVDSDRRLNTLGFGVGVIFVVGNILLCCVRSVSGSPGSILTES